MDTWTAALIVASSILMLFVGFMLGDEAHHEETEVADERDFHRHVQQALFVARRTTDR